jgi:putative component of toxin-antitoxin plasmid stabilization module
MIEIRQTERFEAWLAGLADGQARSRVLVRIDRLALAAGWGEKA